MKIIKLNLYDVESGNPIHLISKKDDIDFNNFTKKIKEILNKKIENSLYKGTFLYMEDIFTMLLDTICENSDFKTLHVDYSFNFNDDFFVDIQNLKDDNKHEYYNEKLLKFYKSPECKLFFGDEIINKIIDNNNNKKY